jgi:hypothetical protein
MKMKTDGGYTGNAWEGSKYNSNRDIAEIAKLVRKEIQDAIKNNQLPQGKYGVTIQRYSGGQSCDIKIKEFEFPIFDSSGQYTQVVTLSLRKLKNILDSYRRDDSCSQIDYFNTNFYGHTEVSWQLREASRG